MNEEIIKERIDRLSKEVLNLGLRAEEKQDQVKFLTSLMVLFPNKVEESASIVCTKTGNLSNTVKDILDAHRSKSMQAKDIIPIVTEKGFNGNSVNSSLVILCKTGKIRRISKGLYQSLLPA